ncbi:MAG: nickel transporter, partial [Actinomycetota bacterium]
MRAIRRAFATAAVALVIAAWPAATASAHPLGNFTVNRAASLQLSPGRLDVDYVVDLAEIPTEQERAAIDTNGDATLAPAELEAWASRTAGALADGVRAEVDGTPISLRVSCATAVTARGQGGLPVLRLEAGLAGVLPPTGTLTWRDANDADRIGWREVTARGTGGVALASSSVPSASASDRLRAYPDELLSDPPDVREARIVYAPGTGDDVFVRPCAGGGTAPVMSPDSGSGLTGLLDREATPAVLGFALLLAAGFGAIHALGPGHGKALMAGTLIGAGARVRQAVAVGGAVSVMHTMSVLALGLLVLGLERTFRPEQIYPWLGLASGLLALGLGAWLLVRRIGVWSLQGRRHEVLDDDHAHDHAHGDGRGQHRHR